MKKRTALLRKLNSECFGFIKDWVERKIRRHMGRSRNRRGFG
jgi:RNA-directed DNA polymerase